MRFRRRDYVHQQDTMQCGVACLAMVASCFGKKYSLPFLSEYCTPTAEGVSLLGIADGARAIGIVSKSYKLGTEALAQIPLPAILHWNQNHFVVLHRISRRGRRFHIADPGKGMRVCPREEFLEAWASGTKDGEPFGIAMLCTPGEDFGKVTDPSVGKGRSLRFLSGYFRRYSRFFVQILLGLLLACLLQLAMPLLTQALVDKGIHRQDIGFVWLVMLGELMIVLGRTVTDFIRRWLLLHVSMRINISLVSDFIVRLLALPMPFFETKHTGDILQRMSDHSRIQTFLTTQVLDLLFTLTSLLVFGAVLCLYSPVVFGVFMLGSVVYAAWIGTFLHRRKVIDYELFEQQSRERNLTYQLVSSMQEVKLQGCGRRRREEWEDMQADLFGVQMKSLRMQQSQEAGSVFINEIKNILVTVLTATAVIHGQLTLGAMLAIQYILGQLNAPVSQLMGFVYSLQDVRISLERINQVHCSRGEADKELNLRETADGDQGIELRDVEFRYDRHARKNTIDGVSLTIPRGKTTAIVGASGSGKTTLVKLMLGYYAPDSGSVRAAGRELRDYDPEWWRSRCGAVMQEGVIFSDSIERNIAVTDGVVDRERLLTAARLANIGEFVESLPLGYRTRIGRDGTGLSQGQKQRILIARAIYRDPGFIFLDEATNSLDAGNEREIAERLEDFFRGRTVVVIAHRLSTVRNADNIVVLDKGRIAEQGTHEELTARRGMYYTLIRNQLELGN